MEKDSESLRERFPEFFFEDTIPKLWEELGVTNTYKNTFIHIVTELDNSVRKEYFEHEIRSLSQFLDILKV